MRRSCSPIESQMIPTWSTRSRAHCCCSVMFVTFGPDRNELLLAGLAQACERGDPPGKAHAKDASPLKVVPWFEGARPTSMCTV